MQHNACGIHGGEVLQWLPPEHQQALKVLNMAEKEVKTFVVLLVAGQGVISQWDTTCSFGGKIIV